MMRIFVVPLLLGFAARLAADPLSFEQALALAEREAPMLAAAQARVEAAQSTALAAGELPDPTLVVGLDNLPITGEDDWSLSDDFMTMQRVGVSQALPNKAKRRARVEQAGAVVDDAGYVLRGERLAVLREAAAAWLDLYFSAERLRQQDALEGENALLAKTVQARYAAGTATLADTLLPEREALALADRHDELRAAQQIARRELERLIGGGATWSPAEDLPRFNLDPIHLREHLTHHPELLVYEAKHAAAVAALREAEAAKHPDWAVEVSYQHRGPRYGDMISAELSVDLPLFAGRRQDPLIAARVKDVAALSDEQAATLRAHRAELERALADYARLERQSARMTTRVLPLAERAIDLAYGAYAAGTVTLAEVLGTRRELAQARFRAIDLSAARLRLAADIHYRYEDGDHD